MLAKMNDVTGPNWSSEVGEADWIGDGSAPSMTTLLPPYA
jgi:hypothetical protein